MSYKLRFNRKNILLAAIYAACVLIIFLTIPDKETNRYSYELGKPWNYDALVIDSNLRIDADSALVNAMVDSVMNHYTPSYYRDSQREARLLKSYEEQLSAIPSLSDDRYRRERVMANIRAIYNGGIIDADTRLLPDQINLRVTDKEKKSVGKDMVITPIEALQQLMSNVKNDTLISNALYANRIDLEPNILYDSVAYRDQMNTQYEFYFNENSFEFPAGSKIVERGDPVTPKVYRYLQAYERQMSGISESGLHIRQVRSIGSAIVILLMLGMLYGFIALFRRDYFANLRVMMMLSLLVTGFVVIGSAFNTSFDHGIYIVPFTIIPIVLLVFLDSRTAFFAYMVTLMTVTALNHYIWDFFVIQFAAGFVALITIRELSKRSQLLSSALWVFLCYSVTYCAVQLMQTGQFSSIDTGMFGALAINSLLISFAYILIFVIEKCFGFISRVTLVELSDINHPLLRELSQECPGTFQHSMAVSNIAAAAAGRLGANVQLIRAGALYHDIGKIGNPAFFTENQHGINPHDTLTPLQSARIITGHVTDGVHRAEKAKLPKQLRDFILQHHGRGTARYFYTTYCNQHPDEEVDPTPFKYPGPNPQTIEASILMMADAVEAASRSLKDHSPESIDALVSKIIDSQVSEGLHNESPISFRDITEIKKSFASTLRTMYHSRIAYPEAVKPAAPDAPGADKGQ